MKEVTSVCPYDCPDACGLLLQVEDDKVVGVKGNPNHTFTRGTLCPKMVHYERTIHSSERLTTPMKRIGKKGVGPSEFEPISWDEAFDTIVEQFKRSIDQFGSESIMRYSYAGTMGPVQKAAADFFFRRIGSTDQDRGICAPAKKEGWKSVMGATLATKPQEAQHSDLIVLWGINAAATDIHFLHDVQAAKKNGATIWAIDTHETYTFKSASEHVLVKPGSDGALALGMMHIMAREGLDNRLFINQYVQGYDDLVAQVLPKYTPEYVESITGVSPKRLHELTHAFAKARAPFIRIGSGPSRYGNGAMTIRLVGCLAAVVGAYEKQGGGVLTSSAGSSFLGERVMQQWQIPTEKKRKIPMVKLGPELAYNTDKPIKCLYIFSSNPANTLPDQNVLRKGLMREDLFTVVHERFYTDTCDYADIILPATSSVEHDDVYNSYGHYSLGTGYQAISPVGESRSNWQVISELARRMGLDDDVFKLSDRELVEIIVSDADTISEDQKKKILAGEPVEAVLPDNYKMQFKTASGKIEILNPNETPALPDYFAPYGDDAEFWLINGNDIRILDSSFCELLDEGNQMDLRMNDGDAERLDIQDGDWVEIYNERGSLQMPVSINRHIQPGTVVTLGVWWQRQSSDKHGNINIVTADRLTDKGDGSTFYDVKVNVRKRLNT